MTTRLWGGIGLLLLILVVPVLGRAETDVPRIVAGTALIEDVVRDLTGNRAEIVVLVPGQACPGHNDVKASDVVFAANADAIILHEFQVHLPPMKSLLDKADKPWTRKVPLDIGGNWVSPPVQREATRRISDVLKAMRPDLATEIEQRTERRLEQIATAEAQAEGILAPLRGKPVLAAAIQADFLDWTGVAVVGTFPGGDAMTPRDMAVLVGKGKRTGAVAVVDNLQTGADAGLPVAEELKIPHIVLTNFPQSLPGTDDYFQLLSHNLAALSGLAGAGQ